MSRWIVTIALAVTPLALAPYLFLSHEVIPKVILILLAAASILFLLPQWAAGLRMLWKLPQGSLFLFLVIAQVVSLALSTAFSTQPALSFAGTVWRRFGSVEQTGALVIAAAAGSLTILQPAWTKTLLRAIAVCGGLTALYGILQYFGLDPFLPRELYALEFLGGVVRPPATLGHAIYFSAWLVPVVLLSAAECGREREKLWKTIHGMVAVLGCLAVILSGTRASVLAIAAGGALLAIHFRQGRLRASLFRLAGAALGIVAVAGAIAISPRGEDLRRRLVQWREDLGGPRLGVWKDTPRLIAERPFLGTGPETFAVEFRKIESAGLSRAYPDFYHETPHNAFLDAACAQGIPGFLILAGLFAFGLRRQRTSSDSLSPLSGLQASMAGMLVGSFFASYTLVTGLFLWSIGGLIAGLPARPQKGLVREEANDSDRAIYWRAPAGLAGVIFASVAILLGAQDAEYARLKRAVSDRNLAAAMRAWNLAVSFSLGMPGYELWSSRQMAELGRSIGNSRSAASAWSQAVQAASLAERRGEERFSATYQSSVLAVAAGDLTRAESKARETIVLAPNWYKPHLLRSQILQAMSRPDEADREAALSRELGWAER